MNARDTIAELLGLVYVPAVRCWYTDPAAEDQHFICADPKHPIPNTLDFMEAWPDSVTWERRFVSTSGLLCWVAYPTGRRCELADTGNELADRMSLYAQVLETLRCYDRPAFDAAVEKARRVMEEERP